MAALSQDDLGKAAIDAALHIPRWSRAHLADARIMLLYRRADLAEQWPDELGAELASLNDAIVNAMRNFVRRRFGAR